uniref:Uncharacterized protein n=1 Tax=Pipistrellus kuhlii TaxID=59472 RepID=A0A7J7WD76_PIPKU|nr:hypothetical protein mPipKuh1_008035 [Pipistrellus kuhlii]
MLSDATRPTHTSLKDIEGPESPCKLPASYKPSSSQRTLWKIIQGRGNSKSFQVIPHDHGQPTIINKSSAAFTIHYIKGKSRHSTQISKQERQGNLNEAVSQHLLLTYSMQVGGRQQASVSQCEDSYS